MKKSDSIGMKTIDMRHLDWEIGGGEITKGLFPKTKEGKKYYKLSAYNKVYKVYGNQSISEVMASRLGKILGIECVGYKLVHALIRVEGQEFITDLCVSIDYNKKRETVIPFELLYEEDGFERGITPLEYCKEIGIEESIYKMFVFDYIIGNFDRHGKNVEVIVGKDGKFRLAPLFDNGMSLFTARGEADIKGATYNDSNPVNNYIGSRYLWENIEAIDKPITLNKLRSSDRQKFFRGLGATLSRDRRDTIWRSIERRVIELGKIRNISWK